MIGLTLLLVVVSAVSLTAGMVVTDELWPLFVAMGGALLAAVVLNQAVRRGRHAAPLAVERDWAPPVPPPPA